MEEEDEGISRRSALLMLGGGAALALGFVAMMFLSSRSDEPLHEDRAEWQYDRPVQEQYNPDAYRPRTPEVKIDPLPPPRVPTTAPAE